MTLEVYNGRRREYWSMLYVRCDGCQLGENLGYEDEAYALDRLVDREIDHFLATGCRGSLHRTTTHPLDAPGGRLRVE